MRTLGAILGSTARANVLDVLSWQPEPVGLRFAARMAGIHTRSAEMALTALVREGLVERLSAARGPRYALNAAHPDASVVVAAFAAVARMRVVQTSRRIAPRALALLPALRSSSQLAKRARKATHAA